jgi:4-hydroxy-tetrahydrodipicolinate synthase
MDQQKLLKLQGTFTALITPFEQGGKLNEKVVRDFIRFQIEAGCGLVPMGTTGESATMSHDEHQNIIEWTVEETENSKNKPFVLAGAGSNSTAEAISLCQHAESMGVDGVLLITPYYNKPTQKGLIAHYSAVADSIDIPIVIYNCPGRTGGNIMPDTVAELVKTHKNIVGYKAAEGKIDQINEVITKCGKDFIVFSGDDSLTYDVMKRGGKGVISVASNIFPDQIIKFVKLMQDNKWDEAKVENDRLSELFKNLFVETNPGPVKYLAYKLGLSPTPDLRLPLVPPEPESCKILDETLKNYI